MKSTLTLLLLIPIVLGLFCPIAQAGSDTFACVVTSVHVVSEYGDIVTDTDFLKEQVGLTFSVDRASGAIRGGGNLSNTGMKSPL